MQKEALIICVLRFCRRCRRDRGSDGPGGGRAGAELRAGAHQLRPGRVLAVAGGGAPRGLRLWAPDVGVGARPAGLPVPAALCLRLQSSAAAGQG